jgi:hypothetical protein
MAIVTGPLHSTDAAGQIGKAIIYEHWRGRHYAKAYCVPGNTPGYEKMNQTPDQLAVQAETKILMKHWPEIPPADQATWDELAIPARTERINEYLKENWKRFRSGRPQLDGWPDIETPTIDYVMTAGEPAPDPDCTGNYTQIADHNGKPAYKRLSTPVYYVYYDTDTTCYAIDEDLGTAPSEALWYLSSETPGGTYDPVNGTGHPIFTSS